MGKKNTEPILITLGFLISIPCMIYSTIPILPTILFVATCILLILNIITNYEK